MRKLLLNIALWFVNKLERHVPIPYKVALAFEHEGVKVYTFDNPLQLPAIRNNALHMAVNDAQLGITKEHLITGMDLVSEYNLSGKKSEIEQTVGLMKAYLNLKTNCEVLFGIANCLYFLEGENPEVMESAWIEKKRDLFDNNPHIRSFFLTRAYTHLLSFSNQSIGHLRIEDYLKSRQVKLTEKAFIKLVTRNIETAKRNSLTSKRTSSVSG